MLLSNKHVDNGNIELLNKKKALLYISAFFIIYGKELKNC